MSNSPEFAEQVKSKFLRFLSVAGFGLDLIKVAKKCSASGSAGAAISGIASVTIGLLAYGARFTGPIGIAIGYLLNGAADFFFKNWLIDYACPQTSQRAKRPSWLGVIIA